MAWTFYENIRHRPTAAFQSGGVSRLLAVGALLRWPDEGERYRRAISQSCVFWARPRPTSLPSRAPQAEAALLALKEIFTRSALCPVAPQVDDAIRRRVAELRHAGPERLDDEASRDLVRRWCQQRCPCAIDAPLHPFDDDPPVGAGLERKFWTRVQTHENGRLRAWIHPQAFFSALLGTQDDRRADYCLCPPWHAPLAWECHGDFSRMDQAKSVDLGRGGVEVFDQVMNPNPLGPLTTDAEIAQQLDILCQGSAGDPLADWEAFLIDAPWVAAQVDLALWCLLAEGAWCPTTPRVRIRVPERFAAIAAAAIEAWTELAGAMERVWGLTGDALFLHKGMTATDTATPDAGISVEIDPDQATYFPASRHELPADLCMRRACFPVDVGDAHAAQRHGNVLKMRPAGNAPDEALQVVMKRLFNKPDFRRGQAEAIRQAISGRDALVLLPTGYGKSMVFQVASFLLPGITLVVEPYKALIDDQARNLQDHGIGHVLPLHAERAVPEPELKRKLLEAQIVYVSPERLHVKTFNQALTEVVRERGLDQFVVDEAHCVSHFGHSFRVAYLDLRERITDMCVAAGQQQPPVLALTATAAQRVVRDIAALLSITAAPVSLEELAPQSFARTHHDDRVVPVVFAAVGPKHIAGAGFISSLEQALRERAAAGQGLVFCPSPNKFNPQQWIPGPDHKPDKPQWVLIHPTLGAAGLRDEVAKLRGPDVRVGLYVGGDTKEGAAQKRQDADEFSRGNLPIMVCTSAFGTGVDLQGVRWTIHCGLPSGLEAYYQETGRAGRDRKHAVSILLVDWDSAEVEDALNRAGNAEDPIAYIRDAFPSAKQRGSLSRQLGLLIGDKRLPAPKEHHTLMDPLANTQGAVYLPSFPGWKWEAAHVDYRVARCVTEAGTTSVSVPCHPYWEDLTWRALHRLATLGVIRHGFTREGAQAGRVEFLVERSPDALDEDRLCDAIHAAVTRAADGSRADAARADLRDALRKHGDAAAHKLQLCGAMLLKHTYQVVYETRVESMKTLIRYAREPDQNARHRILEDYFAPSTFKRALLDLCEEPYSIERLVEARALASAEARWRPAVFALAAEQYPGSPVPHFLLALGAARERDAKEAAARLGRVLREGGLSIALRKHVFQQVAEAARAASAWSEVSTQLTAHFTGSEALPLMEAIAYSMPDPDGESALAHSLVAEFIAASKDQA